MAGTPWDRVRINLSALKLSCQVLHQSSTKVTNRGAGREDRQVSWHRELGQRPERTCRVRSCPIMGLDSAFWRNHISWAFTMQCWETSPQHNPTFFPPRKVASSLGFKSLSKRLCPQLHLLTKCLPCWSSASGGSGFLHYGCCLFTYSPEISRGLFYTRHQKAPVCPCRWVRRGQR